MADAFPSSDLVSRLRDSATKVMSGVPRNQLLEAADEIERLRGEVVIGLQTDRSGWVCSVCRHWNNPKDKHCAHH